jgi:hypothetical protein
MNNHTDEQLMEGDFMRDEIRDNAVEEAARLLDLARAVIISTTEKSRAFVLRAVMAKIAGENQMKEVFRK